MIQLQAFPSRKGSSSYYSLGASESTSDRDRRPDGAEEPDVAMGERRYSRSNMRKSADTLLSSHSKLQQIPERQPLMHSGYHQPESRESVHQRPYDNKVVFTQLKENVFVVMPLRIDVLDFIHSTKITIRHEKGNHA